MLTRARKPVSKPSRQTAELKRELRRAAARFADLFRAWGREGGAQRAKRLTPEQRQEIARKAALARWRKEGKGRG